MTIIRHRIYELEHLATTKVVDRILQHPDTGGRAGIELDALSLCRLLLPRPVRVVRPVIKRLRMGHQAENTAGGVAYPGDVAQGAIGVERRALLCRCSVRHRIPNRDLVILLQMSQCA